MDVLAQPADLAITVAPCDGQLLVTVRHRITADGLEFAHFAFKVPRSFDIRTLEHQAYERLRHWAAATRTDYAPQEP